MSCRRKVRAHAVGPDATHGPGFYDQIDRLAAILVFKCHGRSLAPTLNDCGLAFLGTASKSLGVLFTRQSRTQPAPSEIVHEQVGPAHIVRSIVLRFDMND